MKKERLRFPALWKTATLTAEKDLELILGSVTNLPMKYWRENFFFKGMSNKVWFQYSEGKFPVDAPDKATHPLLVQYRSNENTGFVVCPCSSTSRNKRAWIKQGTELLHTNYIMDKTAIILEEYFLTIPWDHGMQPRFMGEVAKHDIQRSSL